MCVISSRKILRFMLRYFLLTILLFFSTVNSEEFKFEGHLPMKQKPTSENIFRKIFNFLPYDPVMLEVNALDEKGAILFSQHFPKGLALACTIDQNVYRKLQEKTKTSPNIKIFSVGFSNESVFTTWCKQNQITKVNLIRLNQCDKEFVKPFKKVLPTMALVFTKTLGKNHEKYKNLKSFLERKGFTLLSHWYNDKEGEAVFLHNDIFNSMYR